MGRTLRKEWRTVRRCKEPTCYREFVTAHPDKEFCYIACKNLWWGKARTRAGQVYEMLVAWRRTTGKARDANLSMIAARVDGWLREDKEKGYE